MEEVPQEVQPQIPTTQHRPILKNDPKNVSEAWPLGNLLEDLTPK